MDKNKMATGSADIWVDCGGSVHNPEQPGTRQRRRADGVKSAGRPAPGSFDTHGLFVAFALNRTEMAGLIR